MRFVFVMDPVSTVLVDEDTSFALMLAAQARGHRVDHCLPTDLSLDATARAEGRGRVLARLREATMKRDPAAPITLGDAETVDLAEVDAIFIRKDPPFDSNYLWLTLLLEHLRGKTLVLNDPRGLRDANEKLYACHFQHVMPRTIVTATKADVRQFMADSGGRAIIKPVDGHGGEGVFALREGDGNVNGLIEAVTHNGKRVAMVQEFIPEVTEGDKRILLMDGEPLGAILRIATGGDVRSNIHVGGRVAPGEVTEEDKRIIEAVKPRLAADGLYFVGLDVIGGKLTEVNVTSPTGIQQMSRFQGDDPEGRVIAAVERKLA